MPEWVLVDTAVTGSPPILPAGHVVYEDEVFLFGGQTASVTSVCRAYDMNANTWRTLASLPVSCARGIAARVGGYAFQMAGKTSGSAGAQGIQTCRRYDLVADTWDSIASTGLVRSHHLGAAWASKVYIWGGQNGNNDTRYTSLQMYDVVTDTWTLPATLAPCPTNQESGMGLAHDGYLYSIGGTSNSERTANVYRYDIDADDWDTLSPLPVEYQRGVAALYAGRIWVFAGLWGPDASSAERCYVYDIASDTWERFEDSLGFITEYGGVREDGVLVIPRLDVSGINNRLKSQFYATPSIGAGLFRYPYRSAMIFGRRP